MNRSIIIAGVILIALLSYFAYGTLSQPDAAEVENEGAGPTTAQTVPEAVVTILNTQTHPVTLELKGRTTPDRMVTVKAGTTGSVISTNVREGQFVNKGAILCGLDVESRKARVQQAEAMLNAAKIELSAAQTLSAKGLTSATAAAGAEANYDGALAGLNAAKVELAKTQVRAPFAGIFEQRIAEAGDFLAPGAPCGVMVDLSPLILTVEVAEENAGKITTGSEATADIAGKFYPATIRFVASTANQQTRTFVVEAAIDTGKDQLTSGVSGSLLIPLGESEAILLSPAMLTLADDGRVGVRHIDENDTVLFSEVSVLDDDANGVWVTGLEDGIQIVAAGQEFLTEGTVVEPVSGATQ